VFEGSVFTYIEGNAIEDASQRKRRLMTLKSLLKAAKVTFIVSVLK
jgi:hypothetical protein